MHGEMNQEGMTDIHGVVWIIDRGPSYAFKTCTGSERIAEIARGRGHKVAEYALVPEQDADALRRGRLLWTAYSCIVVAVLLAIAVYVRVAHAAAPPVGRCDAYAPPLVTVTPDGREIPTRAVNYATGSKRVAVELWLPIFCDGLER